VEKHSYSVFLSDGENDLQILTKIKVYSLGWLGHVVRKDTGRQTRRMEDKGKT
jgi:hypothetical protein